MYDVEKAEVAGQCKWREMMLELAGCSLLCKEIVQWTRAGVGAVFEAKTGVRESLHGSLHVAGWLFVDVRRGWPWPERTWAGMPM